MNELKSRSVTFGFVRLPGCHGRNCMYGFLFTCILFFGLLFVAAPASAVEWTLTPGDNIQNNITLATAGDTLVLSPGTYEQYNITVSKDIIIKANANAGGSSVNTIIDAMKSGRIFYENSTGGHMLEIEGLTLKNGSAADGGAICTLNGSVTIASSVISACSTPRWGMGGGIYSDGSGNVTAVSCTFSGCSSDAGGAICSGNVTATSCTFTGCTATVSGGAISSYDAVVNSSTFTGCSSLSGGGISSTIVTATSSVFSGCSADGGGAILSANAAITSCTFTGCQANGADGYGGGICSSGSGGVFTIDSSAFSGCSADAGGALFSEDVSVTATSSTFTNCLAADSAGAIVTVDNIILTLTSCNFTNCRAANYAGAIYSDGGGITTVAITSCNFNNCSAVADNGGAFYSENSTSNMHYSRIYDCNTGTAVVMEGGTLNAENNWWGTNSDPSVYTATVSGGTVDASPWLVLAATANSPVIKTGETSTVTADLTFNSDGQDTSAGGHVPDGIPVAFGLTEGPGSLSSLAGTTVSGVSGTTYSSSSPGTATIRAIVDGQASVTSVLVTGSAGGSPGGGGGSNTDTGIGFTENLKAGQSASFNMNKGAVYRVILTSGTDIDKLMITVIREGSLPSSIDPPDTEVYEYEDVTLYYAEDSDISGRTFFFKVKKSWLESGGYSYNDIVMMHYNGETGEWEELATTYLSEDGTYYYYTADTSSFSWFAIGISEGATIVQEETPAAATRSATALSTPSSSTTAVASTKAPAGSIAAEESGSWTSVAIPALAVVLVIIVIIGIAGRKKREDYPDWWDHGRR